MQFEGLWAKKKKKEEEEKEKKNGDRKRKGKKEGDKKRKRKERQKREKKSLGLPQEKKPFSVQPTLDSTHAKQFFQRTFTIQMLHSAFIHNFFKYVFVFYFCKEFLYFQCVKRFQE